MSLWIQTSRPHLLDSKGVSSEFHPSTVKIQLHAVELPGFQTKKITFQMRNSKVQVSPKPYASEVEFPLKYHSIVFDTLKVNLHKHGLLTNPVISQAKIKLAELQALQGDQICSFPLLEANNKEVVIGKIMLKFQFEFEYQSLKENIIDISLVNSPISSLSQRSFGPSSSDSGQSSSSVSEMMSNFNAMKESLEMESLKEGVNYYSMDSSTLRQESLLSFSSTSSTKSYIKRSSKEGLESLNHIYAALTSTGLNLSKIDFGKAMALMQVYNDHYPTAKTFQVVDDDSKFRVAAYFIHFAIATYPPIAINYFGYGKMTDLLKFNHNRKAAISHLNIPKEHMLEWEYETHGIFANKPSFYICYDEKTKAIVLAIRGTFSLADVLLDINCEYDSYQGGLIHHGMLQSMLWIRENYLGKIISYCKKFQAVGMYFVGHSLGASVASLCLVDFRPDLIAAMGEEFITRGYNYGTAPVVSKNLLPLFVPYVENYINEFDPVPKLSYGAAMDFKDIIVHAAELSKNANLSKFEKLESIQKLSSSLREQNRNPRLICPGNIYFLYKTSRIDPKQRNSKVKILNTGCKLIDEGAPHYVLERSVHEHFEDIHIKLDMVFHHFLNKYDAGIRNAHDWLIENK